jgi:SIR2-like domain
MAITHDALRAANEMREQLASAERRLGFFCGAGTSMSVGLPGIQKLTAEVKTKLVGTQREQFELIAQDLPADANVEHILNRVRLYRELIGDSTDREYCKIKGIDEGRALDVAICGAISNSIRETVKQSARPHLVLAQWLRALHSRRDWPVEVFTTNYDVCFEKALETAGVPFFDGFVGSVNPFFAPECIESEGGKSDAHVYPCRAWTRLWKLHGSINWHITTNGATEQITRLSLMEARSGEELAIFPSREKYSQSRKLPFIAMQDRLRKFLAGGDRLIIIIGYSFTDQHLNELLLQALRSNPHLAVTALVYGDPIGDGPDAKTILPDQIANLGREHRNLTIYGPDKASIGGIIAPWAVPKREQNAPEWPFWDGQRFTLGDFNSFSSYLEVFIGFGSSMLSEVSSSSIRPSVESAQITDAR